MPSYQIWQTIFPETKIVPDSKNNTNFYYAFLTDNFNGMRIELQDNAIKPALRQRKYMKTKFKDLITSVDVLNTLHGGVSEPLLSWKEMADSQEVRIRVPGVEKETLLVEIINNHLSVFYFIPVYSVGKLVQMPQVIYNQPIPYFVEVSKIKASFDENELRVILPFNELSAGYKRKIKIV